MPSSAGVDEPAGHGEDVAAQRLGGRSLQPVAGELSDGAAEVVRHDRQGEPGRVGHELARRQVCQAGALELGDGLLDDGVPAVIGLDLGQREVPVGDERVVVPGGEQRQLRTRGRPDPAHDQADGAGVPLVAGEDGEGGLGDVGPGDLRLRQPVRDRLPGVLIDRGDRGADPLVLPGGDGDRTSNFAAAARTALE